MYKFYSFGENGNSVNHDYGNIYFREPCGDSQRLVIGPSNSHVELLFKLSNQFAAEQFYILYILLLSHACRNQGRYQSPLIASSTDLKLFLNTFKDFFEGDGRHHIWLASPVTNDLLVYDQHNVIFAYGDLDCFEQTLIDEKYEESEFWFPAPHGHSYEPENVCHEDALMNYLDWQYYELQPGDEWE